MALKPANGGAVNKTLQLCGWQLCACAANSATGATIDTIKRKLVKKRIYSYYLLLLLWMLLPSAVYRCVPAAVDHQHLHHRLSYKVDNGTASLENRALSRFSLSSRNTTFVIRDGSREQANAKQIRFHAINVRNDILLNFRCQRLF